MNKLKALIIIMVVGLGLYAQTAAAQVTQRWASRYNGSGNGIDATTDMVTDANANVYMCGLAFRSQSGTNDGMIVKYDSTGAVSWSAFYNGTSNGADAFTALVVDNSGNVYVTGRSQSANGFDIITLKFNNTGAFVWERRLDGAAHLDDGGRDITMDAAGNICITGDADMGFLNSYTDIVVAKYDQSGNQVFTYVYNFSGAAIDIPYAITTDASNNIYVTGGWGAQDPVTFLINSQIETISLSPTGTFRWAKQYGIPLGLVMEGYDVRCDNLGNILVTGKVQSTSNGQYQSALLKYNNANGNLIWDKLWTTSGSSEDVTRRIAIDDSNNVYITGYTFRTTNRDQLTLKYTPSGNVAWATAYNNTTYNNAEEGHDIIVRGRWIYTAGYVTGPTVKDFLLLKYDRYNGAEMWGRSYFGPSAGDDGAFRVLTDAVQNVYVGGNSYGGSSNIDWALVKFVQTKPAAPSIIAPTNNATGVSLTPTIDWSDVSGADSYQLQVSTNSGFTNIIVNLEALAASQYTVPSGVLSSNTQYFWRVTALNEFGYSVIGGPWSFTTVPLPPAAPILTSPANNATGTSLTPLLDWNDVSGAATYNVQVSLNSGFTTTVLNQTGVTASQFTVASGLLANNTQYFWRIAAVNPGGTSAWSTVWNFRTGLTSVNQLGGEIPKEFKLYDNYPNPFNPVTKIKFDIASNSEVSLVVYDILGKVVATLVNDKLSAGVYETSFEGNNMASGVYFFRLNAGSYTSIKKMVLTK